MYPRLLLFSLALCSSLAGSATLQQPDRIIYNGDTLDIHDGYPLEPLHRGGGFHRFRVGHFISTNCTRGYAALWMIEKQELYLLDISACNLDFDSGKADLKMLFGDKFINGRVKADWFSDTIYVDIKSESAEGLWTSEEYEFQFKNGKLVSSKLFSNYDRESFYNDRYELHEFVYKHLDWDSLPRLKNDTVVVVFNADSNGTIDSTRVVRGDMQVLNEAMIRAVKTIPQWNVYYYRGAFRRYDAGVRIVFSEENRRKYRR